MSNNYVVIMAGGIGTRFWPHSRKACPKQFLDILGVGQTLIQSTYERFCKIVPKENIYIVTGERYTDLVKEQLPDLKEEQIVAEPSRRNTGPCVLYMAYKLAAHDPYANFVVAPSDHLILDDVQFSNSINRALEFANDKDALVTLGIRPSRTDTGYGYIQFLENQQTADKVYKVKTFTEKPSLDIAKAFIESGDFLWNSGIFIWNVQSIITAFRRFQPELNKLFQVGKNKYNTPEETAFIKDTYAICQSISIDYAIMEFADNVHVIPSNFGWSDLGTWNSLWENYGKDYLGNAIANKQDVMMNDSMNCLVQTPEGKLVVIQGLENFFVIDTDDVLLICKANQEQEVKNIHADVKHQKGEDYL